MTGTNLWFKIYVTCWIVNFGALPGKLKALLLILSLDGWADQGGAACMWRKGDLESVFRARRAEDGLKYPFKGADGEQAPNLRTGEMALLAGMEESVKTPAIPGLRKRGPFKVHREQVQKSSTSWLFSHGPALFLTSCCTVLTACKVKPCALSNSCQQQPLEVGIDWVRKLRISESKGLL